MVSVDLRRLLDDGSRPFLVIRVGLADETGARAAGLAWRTPGGRDGFFASLSVHPRGATGNGDPLSPPVDAERLSRLLDHEVGADRITCALDDVTSEWLDATGSASIPHAVIVASLDHGGRAVFGRYIAAATGGGRTMGEWTHAEALLSAVGLAPGMFVRTIIG